MPQYQYGTMFRKLGISGMGRQGSGWCELSPDGVLVLMSHRNFYGKREGKIFYDSPGNAQLPKVSASAERSIRMISKYYVPEREILLPIGEFAFDGSIDPDGSHEASRFSYATGDGYRARMKEFDPATGHLLCEVVERFSV